MDIPKKIEQCPIDDAVVEIRFEANYPSDAIFGIIYQALKDTYKDVIRLPISDLPEFIRDDNNNRLMEKPHYQLKNGSFVLQIGPQMFSLSNKYPYIGWSKFYPEIQSRIKDLQKLKIIKNITRLGIRYINYFDFVSYDRIKLDLLLNNETVDYENLQVRLVQKTGEFFTTLRISNNVKIRKGDDIQEGTVIDIDTYITNEDIDLTKNIYKYISKGHKEEKNMFFTLLKDDYVKKLKPTY